MLAGLVFGLFGLMLLLAAAAVAVDKSARRALLARALQLRVRGGKDGDAWMWSLSLARSSLSFASMNSDNRST